ncbi:MAG: hypothetical protein ABSF69_20460 [Polyangiaceae bacterium]|jgi:hypothetical protein
MRNRNAKSALSAAVRLVATATITSEALGCGSSTGTSAEDAGREAGPDSSHPADASVKVCSGPATEALIDDMTGSSISFTPPPCGTKGAWTTLLGTVGLFTTPAGGNSMSAQNCGSLCESLYSPLPSGFPGMIAGADAGSVTSDAGADGGTLGSQAMCIAGTTGAAQYDVVGMGLEFAFSGMVPEGGPSWINGATSVPPPAFIDASQYSGIQFWLWVSPTTAAAVASSLEVELLDKNETPGDGVCDPDASLDTACGPASADISGSVADLSQGAGTLLSDDGGTLTSLSAGWQQIWVPWANFIPNPYYGGANETSVDPTTLTFLAFVLQQDLAADAGAAPIMFDFCVYEVSFYH